MNASKQKGTRFESDVCAYLNEHGHPVERRALAGALDKGDIAGLAGIVECKAEKQIDLPAYMREVDAEIANANAPWGVAVVKARGKSTGEAYVVTPLRRWVVEVLPHLPGRSAA